MVSAGPVGPAGPKSLTRSPSSGPPRPSWVTTRTVVAPVGMIAADRRPEPSGRAPPGPKPVSNVPAGVEAVEPVVEAGQPADPHRTVRGLRQPQGGDVGPRHRQLHGAVTPEGEIGRAVVVEREHGRRVLGRHRVRHRLGAHDDGAAAHLVAHPTRRDAAARQPDAAWPAVALHDGPGGQAARRQQHQCRSCESRAQPRRPEDRHVEPLPWVCGRNPTSARGRTVSGG